MGNIIDKIWITPRIRLSDLRHWNLHSNVFIEQQFRQIAALQYATFLLRVCSTGCAGPIISFRADRPSQCCMLTTHFTPSPLRWAALHHRDGGVERKVVKWKIENRLNFFALLASGNNEITVFHTHPVYSSYTCLQMCVWMFSPPNLRSESRSCAPTTNFSNKFYIREYIVECSLGGFLQPTST